MTNEVLAHVSAPATRGNDELFRSLANAYTEFVPFRTHRDEPVQKNPRLGQASGLESSDLVQGERSTNRETTNSSVLTASKESYGSFPSNLSSDDRRHDQNPTSVVDDDDSMRPISRLAQLDRSYLSWRKRATPRTSFSRSKRETHHISSDPDDADTGFIEDSQLAVEILQSQLLDTYSTTSEDTSKEDGIQDEGIGDEEERSSRGVILVQSQHSETVEDVQPPAASRNDALADLGGNLLEEPMDPSIHLTRASQSRASINTEKLCFSMLPTDAFPPAPAVSVVCPTRLPSQITKHLAAIKIKNPNRFAPLNMRRTLEADERGYWLIDCMQWPPKLQWEFWTLLNEHVHSGRVGWGLTLHREADSQVTLGRVKLYCWGEVAEHVWLLLWLCSKGRVSGSGTTWIDANCVAVIEVQ